jgi:hypothetical protein
VFVVADTGRHPTARRIWRHWFYYKVIKEGIYSKDLGAGFERVGKTTLARSNGQAFAERGH